MANHQLATTDAEEAPIPHDRLSFQLHMLQDVLASVRFLAGEGTASRTLYEVLDRIEVLPTVIGATDAESEQLFRDTIGGLAQLNPIFNDVAARVAHDWPSE